MFDSESSALKIVLSLLFVLCCVQLSFSQDSLKILDHSDFLIWNTIQDQQISGDGKIITYRLVPGEGDPELNIYNPSDSTSYKIGRVSKSTIDYSDRFVYGIITPARDTLRMLERKKTDKKEWPGDTLFIHDFTTKQNTFIPYVSSYKVPRKHGDWLALLIKKEGFPADTSKEGKKEKKEITHLVIRQLSTGMQDTLKHVKEIAWAEKDHSLLAIVETPDTLLSSGVYLFKNNVWRIIKKQKGKYAKLSLSPDGTKSSFHANYDTTDAQIPPWELMYYELTYDSATTISKHTESIPLINPHNDMRWSDDGRYLFYGRMEKPLIRDTTLLNDETIDVEIWRTDDPVLYTVQNVNKPADEKRSYLYAFDTSTKKHVAINSPAWETASFVRDANSRYVLVYTDRPYQLGVTWLGEAAKDLAIVDLQNGKLTPFRKEIYTSPRLSPGGKYAYGYSETDTTWWSYHIVTGIFSFLNTKGLPLFYDELNDVPGLPGSYGSAGWTTNDEELIVNDRYDLWKWNPLKSKTPVRITNGRITQNIHRYIHTDTETDVIPAQGKWLIHVTDDEAKSTAYTWLHPGSAINDSLAFIPYELSKQVTKARESDAIVFRKQNFSQFPELEITTDQFNSSRVLTDANPQQNQYKWGTIEIYEWMDEDSINRQGLLVKPFGYDNLRTYPMIVNFYERYTDALHSHPTPEPHRSTINYAFYASRGYVIFNPDINYKIGYPGESAYRIVMSGVHSLVKNRIADPENMALQGHSWGGYQIAYIVTRTDIFKCAEAGASVVNMTSAYGGIRWGTGLSRMFQYEKAQSRLGRTLWEDPQLYIVNSPLFKIDKIKTPLLLLHNDEDAAVPFEQGIEFYLALRRLGKKAWLLNYRGEPHWPVKWHNRKDFQIRMSQFFDHYLKGAPMPVWMEKGISALERGINRGY